MKKMLSIMLVFLILIGLTESVTASEGTDEVHNTDKKGKKVHLHAQDFGDEIYSVFVYVSGESEPFELFECGNSKGQFMTNIDIPKLKDKILYFEINGDIHKIGTDSPITFGKVEEDGEDGHDHEVTETTSGEDEGATEGSEESHEEGQGKGKCKGKDKEKGGHETIEETTNVQSSEENGQEFDVESSSGAAVQVTSQAAVSAEESHEEGGGALNYWMNKLLDRYTITATADPIGTASLNIDEPYYLEDEDVDVGFVPVNGRYITRVERTTSGAISVDITDSLILLNDVLTDNLTDLSSNVEYLIETEGYLGIQVHANIENSITSNEHRQYKLGTDASFTITANDDYLIKSIEFDEVIIDALKVTEYDVTIANMLVDTDVYVTVEKIYVPSSDKDDDDGTPAGEGDGATTGDGDGITPEDGDGATTGDGDGTPTGEGDGTPTEDGVGTEGGTTTETTGGTTPTIDVANTEEIPAGLPVDGEDLESSDELADDDTAKADNDAVLLEEALPQADGELPSTGGFPLEAHLIIGFVSSGIGTLLRRKNKR